MAFLTILGRESNLRSNRTRGPSPKVCARYGFLRQNALPPTWKPHHLSDDKVVFTSVNLVYR
jgi:hypothetical protein